MELREFSSSAQLNQECAVEIAQRLRQAIARQGFACLAVSGGKTPEPLFVQLSLQNIPWEKVRMTLVDERWVDPNTPDSNEFLLKRSLLQNHAAKAVFTSLYAPTQTVQEALAEIEERLVRFPLFDVVILGMGTDGHTASLFPCSEQINKAMSDTTQANVMALQPETAAYPRISLTKQRLLQSRVIFIHIVGEHKKAVLQRAMEETDELAMPVRAFLFQPHTEVQVIYAPN